MPIDQTTIRCPACRGLAAVPPETIGQTVACPFCAGTFMAIPEVAVARAVKTVDVPLVFPRRPTVAVAIDSELDPVPEPDRTIAIGTALLPLGLPLLWTVAVAFGRGEPLFTSGVPIGLGIGATVLALGAAFTRDWSASGRLKAVFAIVLLAYGVGAGLFFMKKEWAEAVRKRLSKDEFGWVVYNPGPFLVKFPGNWKPDPDPLVPEWKLYAVRHFDPKVAGDLFRVAHGEEPNEIANLADEKWFDAVKAKLTNDETGEALRSSELTVQGYAGREFFFTRSDGATNLTVRVFRVGPAMIMMAAEGALLPADAIDVTKFFKSLYIDPRVKR
jgi:hypothetical protein